MWADFVASQSFKLTSNKFGGLWTEDKLNALRDYLQFYCKALAQQPFKLIYIDAFAGTGRCDIKNVDGSQRVIDGSAKIALDCNPGFAQFRFIENKRKHIIELQSLIKNHPNGTKAHISERSAQDVLPAMLLGYDWKSHRGVLFLDPFGLQCKYSLLKQIASTGALDVFFLVSLSGLFRQAAINQTGIDEGKAAILTDFLGTKEWRSALYIRKQDDLFDDPQISRDPGWEPILKFTTERLRTVFPYVGEPNLMKMKNGVPLFALYFAVSNRNEKAIGLAKRVSKDILSKLRD